MDERSLDRCVIGRLAEIVDADRYAECFRGVDNFAFVPWSIDLDESLGQIHNPSFKSLGGVGG